MYCVLWNTQCFILRAVRLSNKLPGQGYVKERLKSSLRKFYGRYGDLTKQYKVPLSRMLHDILDDDHIQWHPPLIGHYTNFWPLLLQFTMPTEDAYSSGHLVLSHFGTCMCSNVETNLSWTCLVSGLLNLNTPRYFSFTVLGKKGTMPNFNCYFLINQKLKYENIV